MSEKLPTAGRLRIVDLRLSYQDGVDVIRDLSLDLAPGTFAAIMGPSGSGKSTLIAAIAGFIAPRAGEIWLDDKRVTAPSSERGVVFQQFALFPHMTALRNVEYGLKLAGVPRGDRRTQAMASLERVGLATAASAYPHQLSVGMQQRVALARSLITRPRVLLLDEPFGALDALTKRQCQELLLAVWEETRPTVLMVSHDVDECLRMADQVIVLSGHPARTGPTFPGESRRAERPGGKQSFVPLTTRERILQAIDSEA